MEKNNSIVVENKKKSVKKIKNHVGHVGLIAIACSVWCIFGIWVSKQSRTNVLVDLYYHPVNEDTYSNSSNPLLYSVFKNAPSGSPEGLNYQNLTVLPFNAWMYRKYFVPRFTVDQYTQSEADFFDENPIVATLGNEKYGLFYNVGTAVSTVALNIGIFRPTKTGMI